MVVPFTFLVGGGVWGGGGGGPQLKSQRDEQYVWGAPQDIYLQLASTRLPDVWAPLRASEALSGDQLSS